VKDRAREQWDAVVIGSGLGGLACAAYLCASGRRTLVLESHYVAGGNSQAFRRSIRGRSYEFDVGVHYIGECGRDGMITSILRGVGLSERIVFRPLDSDGYSTLVFPDLTFRVPCSWDRYRARLLEAFPDEAAPLGRVVDVLRRVGDDGNRLQRGEIRRADLASEAPAFLKWGLRPVTDLFAEHGLSQRAGAVLLGEQLCYAVRPSRTPVAMHAGLTAQFMGGTYYPEGGGQAIAARLVEAIRAYGGEVRTRAPVAAVRIERGRAAGVTLEKTGQEIDAPVVVSNADLKRTIHQLVGDEHFPPETVERVRSFRMAHPLFVVYLGLDVDLVAQGTPNTNYFVWSSYDIEGAYDAIEAGRMPDEDVVFATVTSTRDPASRHVAPEGHTNLQLMTLVPSDYGIWNVDRSPAEGGRYHRDPEYRRRKDALSERLIEAAERVLPGLRDHIDWKEAASPVTQERFTRSTGGTSYGIELSLDQIGPFRMGPATEVPGLFLCGASTPSGPGVSGVLRSGVIAASAVLGKNLFRAVLEGEVFGDLDRLPALRDDWDAWRESH
jgi:all-trans-retinol 13,14-reductase